MTGERAIRRSTAAPSGNFANGRPIFLDFDGTLAEIAATPDQARTFPDGAETLARLSDEYALVAVVSGRPASQVRARLDIPKLVIFGLYGLDPGVRSK